MYKSQIQSILQLDSHSKRYFKGVFAIDELPWLLPMSGYVINYDEHNKEGSHWVAVFANAKTVEYFDPNGQQPLDKRLSDFIGPLIQSIRITTNTRKCMWLLLYVFYSQAKS